MNKPSLFISSVREFFVLSLQVSLFMELMFCIFEIKHIIEGIVYQPLTVLFILCVLYVVFLLVTSMLLCMLLWIAWLVATVKTSEWWLKRVYGCYVICDRIDQCKHAGTYLSCTTCEEGSSCEKYEER